MYKGKILFICGSMNQTTMMHKISTHLSDYDCYFTPYYGEGFIKALSNTSLLDFSLLGGQFRKRTIKYLQENKLNIDFEGKNYNYDLVFTCSDLIVPKNIKDKKLILVQEGMTDPENLLYHLVKNLKLPRWLASTSTTGLSDEYDKFCVASEGYKEHFIKKGVKKEKISVTGIPNFDNCKQYLSNNFPHKNFVLVATSDSRETYKFENRKKFIEKAKEIANGKQLIFKLHPNENVERATAEINIHAPGAMVFHQGNTEHMIANCDVLVTKYSSVVYVGIALGKEVYSKFDLDELKKLQPIQNEGTSSLNIANVARELLADEKVIEQLKESFVLDNKPKLFQVNKKSKSKKKYVDA